MCFSPFKKQIVSSANKVKSMSSEHKGKSFINNKKSKGGSNLIGKKVTIILPERYPVTEIGGNLGSKDGGEGPRRGRQSITWRVPAIVPLLTVGLFLHDMNESAPKAARRILEFAGPRESQVYLVPVNADEKAKYIAGLAKMEEGS